MQAVAGRQAVAVSRRAGGSSTPDDEVRGDGSQQAGAGRSSLGDDDEILHGMVGIAGRDWLR